MERIPEDKLPGIDAAKETVVELRDRIKVLDSAYYRQSKPLVEDNTYDSLMNQLKILETAYPELISEFSPTQKIGSDLTGNFSKVHHKIPMLSISNVYNSNDLSDWLDFINRQTENTEPAYVCELKIDGLAIAIQYHDGKLISAVTRGDGTTGEEVTQNIRTIRSLPEVLPKPVSFELRGEVYFPKSKFMAYNRQRQIEGLIPYKNPRNAASGCIRMKNPEDTAQRELNLFIYDVVDGLQQETHSDNLKLIGELELPATPHAKLCMNKDEILAFCRSWETQRKALDFDIDGIVIKVDRLKDRQLLGVRAKSPRWAVAWKFTAKQAETKITGIENSIGRTGVITPVALLEPVELLGTVVKRATLHNYEQIARLDIRIGDTLFVEKGGDIIPKAVAVNLLKRKSESVPVIPPKVCPDCGTPVYSETPIEIKCVNSQCGSIILGELKHFVSRKALDIHHLGPAVLEKLLEKGLIKNAADIFSLPDHADIISKWDGFGKKSADNIIYAVNEARQRPLDRYINAFGMANIGENASKILSQSVESLRGLLSVTENTLKTLPDFGGVMVHSVIEWVSTEKNIRLVNKLISMGINPVAAQTNAQHKKNETVVITGKLTKPREAWKMVLEQAGYRVASAVSAKTKYLLTGDNSGKKLDQATKFGVLIVNEEEMNEILRQNDTDMTEGNI